MPVYFLSLFLNLAEPLQFGTNASLSTPDNAVDQVQCILHNMNAPFELQALPWLRARREVKEKRLDGYFTTHLTSEMSHYGQLSSPIFLENWYWFTHPKSISKDPSKLRYGVVHGSYQANWFKTQKITSLVEVNSLQEIVNVLHHHRVDKVLLDLDDFNLAANNLKIDPSIYKKAFYRYVPLGLFAANKLIDAHPKFLERFDETIPQCAPDPFSLSHTEKEQILAKLFSATEQLISAPLVVEAVKHSNNKKIAQEQIYKQDKIWIEEVKNNNPTAANKMLEQPVSQYLKSWQMQFNGVITEVIVADKQGKNVAISKVTSDYYQADETKFNQIFNKQLNYHFDFVEYDASTHHFQVQLSVPIKNKAKHHSGVIILGVDVEKALLSLNKSL